MVGNRVTSGSGTDLSRGLDLNQRHSVYETALQCRKSLNFLTYLSTAVLNALLAPKGALRGPEGPERGEPKGSNRGKGSKRRQSSSPWRYPSLPAPMEPPSRSPNAGAPRDGEAGCCFDGESELLSANARSRGLGQSALLPQNFIHRFSLRQLVN
jgi:hypothetical protein